MLLAKIALTSCIMLTIGVVIKVLCLMNPYTYSDIEVCSDWIIGVSALIFPILLICIVWSAV
jgi:hypothetical protein